MSNANALMKGHTWAKGKHKLTWPAVAELKVDEIRLDVRRVECPVSGGGIEFQSYADKPLHNLGQFAETFLSAMRYLDLMRLDMGVLVNSNFNDTYRYVRSSKGIPSDLLGVPIKFILFDDPGSELEFRHRIGYLDHLRTELFRRFGLHVLRPLRQEVNSEDEVFSLFGKVRDEGGEGLMVKDYDHKYQVGKRTYGWLKVKPEEDADGIITAINQATSIEGVPLDRAGSVTIAVEDGSTADCAGIDHDLGRLMLAHPEQFLGKWAEFKYMERDRQGGYRHPRFNRIREDKA